MGATGEIVRNTFLVHLIAVPMPATARRKSHCESGAGPVDPTTLVPLVRRWCVLPSARWVLDPVSWATRRSAVPAFWISQPVVHSTVLRRGDELAFAIAGALPL